MIKLGILLTNRYRLLSVAAILDVFEMVNKFYTDKGDPAPFEISLVDDKEIRPIQNDILFHGYLIRPLYESGVHDLVLVPAFNNEDITNAIQENYTNIGWLKYQYESGAGLASFCTGAFLLGATGLLKEKLATTQINSNVIKFSELIDVNDPTFRHALELDVSVIIPPLDEEFEDDNLDFDVNSLVETAMASRIINQNNQNK